MLWWQSLTIVTFWHFCLKVQRQGFQKTFLAFHSLRLLFYSPSLHCGRSGGLPTMLLLDTFNVNADFLRAHQKHIFSLCYHQLSSMSMLKKKRKHCFSWQKMQDGKVTLRLSGWAETFPHGWRGRVWWETGWGAGHQAAACPQDTHKYPCKLQFKRNQYKWQVANATIWGSNEGVLRPVCVVVLCV